MAQRVGEDSKTVRCGSCHQNYPNRSCWGRPRECTLHLWAQWVNLLLLSVLCCVANWCWLPGKRLFLDKGSDLRGSAAAAVNTELGRCPLLCELLWVSSERRWAGAYTQCLQGAEAIKSIFLCASPELCPECREGLLCQQQRDLREYTQATIYIHKVVDNKKVRISPLVLTPPGTISFNRNCTNWEPKQLNKQPSEHSDEAAIAACCVPTRWNLLVGMVV